jgi:hypothetical protein
MKRQIFCSKRQRFGSIQLFDFQLFKLKNFKDFLIFK